LPTPAPLRTWSSFPSPGPSPSNRSACPSARSSTCWACSRRDCSRSPTSRRNSAPAIRSFAVFAILAIAFGRTRIPIYGETTISIAVVGDIAIALLFGPAGAAIISPLVTLSTNSGGAWYKRLFNVGSDVVVNVATASIAWALMGGGLRADAWAMPITVFAVMVYYVLNISMVTLAVSLATRSSILAVWREKFEWLLPHYVVFGMLGLALAVAYEGMGFYGLLAFVAPPLMLRLSLKQYIDKTAQNVDELNREPRALAPTATSSAWLSSSVRRTTARRSLVSAPRCPR
jgi:hypothetical protein